MRRIGATVVLGVALAWMSPAATAGAPVAWTLVITPSAVTTGTTTTFSLTATNGLLGQIRCLWVDVLGNFAVHGATVVGSSEGGAWTSSLTGNRVRIWTTSGGQQLGPGAWVDFTIRASANSAGQAAWNANAYPDQGCSSGSTPLSGAAPVVVVTDPAPAATPVPTPALTVAPTASPPPTPAPTVVPTPRGRPQGAPATTPTAGTPPPAAASSAPAPAGQSAEPVASADPDEGTIPGTGEQPPPEAPFSAGGAGDGTEVLVTSDRWLSIQLDDPGSAGLALALGSGFGDATIWAVPAATIAGPGVLLLVLVGLQAAGAAAWIPAVRQLRGERPEGAPDSVS